MKKNEELLPLPPKTTRRRGFTCGAAWYAAIISSALVAVALWQNFGRFMRHEVSIDKGGKHDKDAKVVRSYNLTVGARWLNLGNCSWSRSNSQPLTIEQMAEDGDPCSFAMASHPAQLSSSKKEISWIFMSPTTWELSCQSTGLA